MNACRAPGKWKTFDIVFRGPKYEEGKLAEPARLTMFHNGVLVRHNQEIYGTTPHARLARYLEKPVTKGPVAFGAHHCSVRSRDVWARPL